MKIRKWFLYVFVAVVIIAGVVIFYGDKFFIVKSTAMPEVVVQNVEEESIAQEESNDEVNAQKLLYGYEIKGDKVYYRGQVIVDADAKTFETIGEFVYSLAPAKDYYAYYEKGVLVSQSGSNFFKEYGNHFFKRGVEVYGIYNSEMDIIIGPIKGADPATFESINEFYSKDAEDVFYYESKIEGADPSTFEIVELPYTKDKNHIYRNGVIVLGASPENFSVVKSELKYTYYGKDSVGVYYENKLQDADPNTFYIKTLKATEKYNIEFGADADGLYNDGVLLVGINPNMAYLENSGGIVRDADTKWYRQRTSCDETRNIYVTEDKIPEAERAGWVGGGC